MNRSEDARSRLDRGRRAAPPAEGSVWCDRPPTDGTPRHQRRSHIAALEVAMRKLTLILVPVSFLSCGREPVAPPPADLTAPSFRVETAVDICHRAVGRDAFILITVAATAADAHVSHGDGRVGDPVPGQPGRIFDATCAPVQSRHVISVSGSWDGTTFWFAGLFTVATAGPVDATVTVSGFTDPMRLVLLGFNPEGPQGNTCNMQWLPSPLPPGPTMSPPTITAHWDAILPGTYCLNVGWATAMWPYPPPYSWTATITYP